MTLFVLFQLEKNKFHIQQLEGDVVKCREQVARSEEECRAAQREIKRLQVASNDQRDALANEVSLEMTTAQIGTLFLNFLIGICSCF